MFFSGKAESGKYAYVPKRHIDVTHFSGKAALHGAQMKSAMLHMMDEMKEKKAPHNSLEKHK